MRVRFPRQSPPRCEARSPSEVRLPRQVVFPAQSRTPVRLPAVQLGGVALPAQSEESWEMFGHDRTVFDEAWPAFDAEKAKEDQVTIAVQINGKLRDTFTAARDLPDEQVADLAVNLEKVKAQLDGKTIIKRVVVKNRIVNLVVK